MKSSWLGIAALVVVIAAGAWAFTRGSGGGGGRCCSTPPAANATDSGRSGTAGAPPSRTASAPEAAGSSAARTGLPRLVDLGAKTCIPCKMMAPILDNLRQSHADQFVTEFIDVRENPQAGRKYAIGAIPTQIFFDATGRELYRHEGFLAKEAILAKWKELGVPVR